VLIASIATVGRSSNDFRYILYVNPLNFFRPKPLQYAFRLPISDHVKDIHIAMIHKECP
tara:strand:- start:1345 stop:1521 length:177 start_codon:yes stop_codon:yes gene_type:complete